MTEEQSLKQNLPQDNYIDENSDTEDEQYPDEEFSSVTPDKARDLFNRWLLTAKPPITVTDPRKGKQFTATAFLGI